MNKHERILARKLRAMRLARACGWTEPFNNLPEKTQQAFRSPNDIRLGGLEVSDRKGFSRDSLSHSISRGSHLPRKLARQRADIRAGWEEADMLPPTNKLQRETGRFVKRPKKHLNAR